MPDMSGVIASAHKEAIIELAAIKWLMGQGWSVSSRFGDGEYKYVLHRWVGKTDDDWPDSEEAERDTLAEALLAAVRRGVGDEA